MAYLPDVTVRHWCARSEHYQKYRDRDYVGLAMSKHGISVYTDMFGAVRVRSVRSGFRTECLTATPSCARGDRIAPKRCRSPGDAPICRLASQVPEHWTPMSRSRRSGTVVSCSSSVLECGALFAFSNEHEGEAKKDRDHLRRSFQDGIPQVPRSYTRLLGQRGCCYADRLRCQALAQPNRLRNSGPTRTVLPTLQHETIGLHAEQDLADHLVCRARRKNVG